MERDDLEILFVGKDLMMRFINGPVADELGIERWMSRRNATVYDWEKCFDKECLPPLRKVWSAILQDVISYGDPLATFHMTALKYHKYFEDHEPNDYDEDVTLGGGAERDDICVWCKDRMAHELDHLWMVVFDKLPSFFPQHKPP
jgi:hypothetical protein